MGNIRWNKKKDKKTARITLAALCIVLLGAALLLFIRFYKPAAQRRDYRNISSQEYDTVFLSMYPADTYREEDFSHYYAMTLFKASYCIPEFSILEQYMERVKGSGNAVSTVYLGIRPDLASPQKLQELADLYPEMAFEVILAYPSADYWRGLGEEAYGQTLAAYSQFLLAAPDISNVKFYYMGSQEWLIANPANYESLWLTTEDISRRILLHCDRRYGYQVTAGNASLFSQALAELTEQLRIAPPDFPDLSGHCLVLFGDSVIANYSDSTSIPEVITGLTGAAAYNCGIGGGSASSGDPSAISLPVIADAFCQKDLSLLPAQAADTNAYKGIERYLSDPPDGKKMCFIINYGLNDYFNGCTVASQDPYDITSYCGAIRTAVNTIRTNIPDAQIILCTPNFNAAFQYGTEPHGDGYVLEDYVDAVLALSEELQTTVLDNYHTLGLNHDNLGGYLEDEVHPNAACRYLIGRRLAGLIE